MSQKDCWDIAGVIANAMSAFGTFAAVAVTLWITYRNNRESLKLDCSESQIPNSHQHIRISITNLSNFPVKIISFGWRLGKNRGIQPNIGPFAIILPHYLPQSDTFDIDVARIESGWYRSVVEQASEQHETDFNHFYCIVTTSKKTYEFRPDRSILDKLEKALHEVRTQPAPDQH